MNRKLLSALLIFLVFFTGFAGAQYYTINSHTIDIAIDEDGFALISEKFFLSFPNDTQLKEFRAKNEQIGINLDSWKTFDNRIRTYIGRETEINRAEVSFVETNGKYLEIKYSLNKPIAEKKAETSRLIEFSLSNNFFDQFLQGGVRIIPENTAINIKLPNFAEIQQPVKPEAIIGTNQVTWQGYKSTNVLQLNYTLVKQIASISLLGSLDALAKSPLFIFIISALVIFLAIVLVKTISEKIENYIVENSELGQKEEITQEEKTE